jgi:hypothetical protein
VPAFCHLTKYSAAHLAGQGGDRTHTRFEIGDPPLQFSDLNTDGAQDLRRPERRARYE